MENQMICECPNCKPFQKQEKKECRHRIWKHRCLGCDEIIELEKTTPSPEKLPQAPTHNCGCPSLDYHVNHEFCWRPKDSEAPAKVPSNAVEEKIKEFVEAYRILQPPGLEDRLRDLVRLARETK